MLETSDASGRGLRVEFFRRGDRYAHLMSHVIALPEGNFVTPIWESIEGTDADDWPPSPPLQQLSLETLATGRRALLLVGMAGTSHWSLSVESSSDGNALIFDVACRVKQSPTWLGSRYRLCDGPGGLAEWSASMGQIEHGATGDRVAIQPTQTSLVLPATARWSYRIARANPEPAI